MTDGPCHARCWLLARVGAGTSIIHVTAVGGDDSSGRVISFYQVLGVSPSAPVEAIKLQYRKRVLKCHPDKVAGKEVGESMTGACY
jgi:DnaJ-domain-containing protein 1